MMMLDLSGLLLKDHEFLDGLLKAEAAAGLHRDC
jgi:hypothetical protein